MKNATRYYRLSNSTLATLNAIDSNRSRIIAVALKEVYDDPQIILRELTQRMNGNGLPADSEQSRATAYLPGFVAGGLDDLVKRLSLPIEDVVRLAIDAYIRRVGAHTKASNEPSRPVQPASERRADH